MSKRKNCSDCKTRAGDFPITHFDAALDLLVSETYSRVFRLAQMYEKAGGAFMDQSQCIARWQEAVRRWDCMQSLSGLSWGSEKGKGKEDGVVSAVELEWSSSTSRDGRGKDWEWNSLVLPHAGVKVTKALSQAEEEEYRRWSPQLGNVVLIDMADGSTWPGKIIDKKAFFKARTMPKGYHYYPVRVFSKDQAPVCTVKSRVLPFAMRPQPPPDAAPPLIEAYRIAANSELGAEFDKEAEEREKTVAAKRAYATPDEKAEWNKQVNWIMNERRQEKLRNLREERDKKLKEDAARKKADLTQSESDMLFRDGDAMEDDENEVEGGGKRRKAYLQKEVLNGLPERGGLFKLTSLPGPDSPMLISRNDPALRKQPAAAAAGISMASFIRPALSDPKNIKRSPRRPQALRKPIVTGSFNSPDAPSAPSIPQFEFVSPLGSKALSRLAYGRSTPPPLPPVVEAQEDEGEWMPVASKANAKARGTSAPCASTIETADGMDQDEEL